MLSVLDHTASAGSNALIVLAVTKWEGLAHAGDFAIAYSFFLLALGLCRALLGEPLLQMTSAQVWRVTVSTRSTAGAAVTFLAAAAALAAIAALLDGRAAEILLVFAAGTPVLLLQDYQRHQLFGLRSYSWALASDGWWLAASLGAFLFAPHLPGTLPQAWVVSGCLAVVLSSLGLASARGRRDPADAAGTTPVLARGWRSALIGNFVITQGSTQAVILIIAATAGATAAGAIRAVATPYGLLFVLYTGVGVVLLTSAREASLRRVLWLYLAAAAAMAAGLALTPDVVGRAVFGSDGWDSVEQLNLPIAASLVGQGWVYAASLLWRRRGDVERFVRIRVFANVWPLAGAFLGAAWGGAMGAAVGLAVAHLFGGGAALVVSRRWLRTSGAT